MFPYSPTVSHRIPDYMIRQHRVKTSAQVREDLGRLGKPVAEWAREKGFKPNLVYEVLRGRIQCRRGKSHRIAVLLGLKEGRVES